MRFLFCLPPFSPRPDVRFLHAAAAGVRRRGHDVCVLYYNRAPTDSETADLARAGLTWVHAPFDGCSLASQAWRLRRLLRDWRPDVVDLHFSATTPGLLAAALTRVPVRVAWYHTSIRFGRSIYPGSALAFRVRFAGERLVRRLATHHVVLSAWSRAEYLQWYRVPAGRVHVQPLGIDLGPAPAGPGVAAGGTRDAEPLLLCVSRLAPLKGQNTLIRCLPGLLAPQPRLRLVCVGPGDAGPLRVLAERLGVAGACEFLGELPYADVAAWYRRATLALFPSHAEASGLVVLEALAAGTPLLSSRVGIAPEVIEDGVSGVLLPAGDVAAWRDGIAALLTDPVRRAVLGAAGRARAAAFDLATQAARYAEWLTDQVR